MSTDQTRNGRPRAGHSRGAFVARTDKKKETPMSQYLLPSLINGGVVALSLFALWSFVTRMRELPTSARAQYAAVAGAVSAVFTLVVTSLLAGTA